MRNYLALCRFPAVFTATADIFLGYVLTAGPSFTQRFGLAILASAGLYLGGMVLNDLLDEAKDAVERPTRPIPSGRVSNKSAWVFYSTLTAVGLIAAAFVGMTTLGVAAALAVLVWLYDGPLKRTVLGPLTMGACRSGNIILGASAGLGTWASIQSPQIVWIAGAMGLYICGLTVFARQEAGQPTRAKLLLGWLIANAGLALAVAWAGWHTHDPTGTSAVLGLIVLALIINQRISRAIVTPAPAAVQAGVRTMLLALPIWNATLIAMTVGANGRTWAIATASLLIPALFAGRFLKLT